MLKLPLTFCQKHRVVLFFQEDKYFLYCLEYPGLALLDEVSRYNLKDLEIKIINVATLENMIQSFYYDSDMVAQIAFENLKEDSLESIAQSLSDIQNLLASNDDAPITRLINVLIAQAVRERASDIHIEVYEQRMRIRFRVDGILREILEPNHALSSRIIARIKVMSKLDIAEKRLPQDGRISTKFYDRNIDIRVSCIPTVQSEKVVLRLLEKQEIQLNLSHLELPKAINDSFKRLIHQTQGIVLVTGPTGSGKTTTLYSALAELNDFSKNIMTVEDPIEYDLDGINQTAVNTKTGMSFSRSLRAMLRQDPDVIMIGEIRDVETAQIAIQASLTGHLVFSTLHTNTAIGAISRLRDMGLEPFLLASSLSGILAQRLIRLLCNHCKVTHYLSQKGWRNIFDSIKQIQIYRSAGCQECYHSGYNGRIGIYELVLVDRIMKIMIHDKVSELKLSSQRTKTQRTLRDNALSLVLSGQTSLDEIYRVLG